MFFSKNLNLTKLLFKFFCSIARNSLLRGELLVLSNLCYCNTEHHSLNSKIIARESTVKGPVFGFGRNMKIFNVDINRFYLVNTETRMKYDMKKNLCSWPPPPTTIWSIISKKNHSLLLLITALFQPVPHCPYPQS